MSVKGTRKKTEANKSDKQLHYRFKQSMAGRISGRRLKCIVR